METQKMTKLLEQLAEKLGTTSEYLWDILIQQAPISATITLCQLLMFGLFIVVWIKYLKWGIKNDELDEFSIHTFILFIGGLVLIIFIFASIFEGIPDLINGYFNPEFWAFDYILGKIK